MPVAITRAKEACKLQATPARFGRGLHEWRRAADEHGPQRQGASFETPHLRQTGKRIPVGRQELFIIVGSNAEPELPLADDRTIDAAATEAGLSASATIHIFVSVRSHGS